MRQTFSRLLSGSRSIVLAAVPVPVVSVLVFSLISSGAAFAAGITPIAQTRTIMAHADVYTGDPTTDSAPDFLPFDSTVYQNAIGTCELCGDAEAWAHQDSWFSSWAVQLEHSVWFGGYSEADSSFLLDFILDRDRLFTLIWSIDVFGEAQSSNVSLTNLDSGQVVFDIFTNGPFFGEDSPECLDPNGILLDPCVGTRSGELTAATYRLTSDIGSMYYGSSATVSFQMEVVPEPSTTLLLAAGLAGLAARRSRPHKRASNAGARLDSRMAARTSEP